MLNIDHIVLIFHLKKLYNNSFKTMAFKMHLLLLLYFSTIHGKSCLIFYLIPLINKKITGIPVAEFQMDGFFTLESFLKHSGGIGQNNLTDFTLCMRHNINFLRGLTSHSLSYTSHIDDNTLMVWFEKSETDLLAPIVLSVCKYPFRSNDANECNLYFIGIKPHHQWHHFCFIITSKETIKGMIESTMILIYDGIFVKEGIYYIIFYCII